LEAAQVISDWEGERKRREERKLDEFVSRTKFLEHFSNNKQSNSMLENNPSHDHN
jgi:hypothetical protein